MNNAPNGGDIINNAPNGGDIMNNAPNGGDIMKNAPGLIFSHRSYHDHLSPFEPVFEVCSPVNKRYFNDYIGAQMATYTYTSKRLKAIIVTQ